MQYARKVDSANHSISCRSSKGTSPRTTKTAAVTGPGRIAAAAAGKILTAITALGLIVLLSACKVRITVPEGGTVVTRSGNIICAAGDTCEIDVVDQYFDETFMARPDDGYVFKSWAKVPRGLCGKRTGDCPLATTNFNGNPKLMAVLESDTIFHLQPMFEAVPRLTEADLRPAGQVFPTEDGFEVIGSLAVTLGDKLERAFTDAELEVAFNRRGELLSMTGEGLLPRELTDHVALPADVRAEIALYTGAEINADGGYEITLKDERQYFVFRIDAGVELEISSRDKSNPSETLTLGTPAAGKIIMILDPIDAMLYRYGETPLVGAFGEAESDKGLLPYEPWIANDRLDRFDGHSYRTISLGVGIKVFDFFNLSGTQVVRDPKFSDVDLSDPFNSKVNYRAGFNGAVDFAFSVVGFDLFAFDLAESSATFEVSRKRQAMTLAADLDPDLDWMPDWVPVAAEGRIAMDLTADSTGDLQANLEGEYRSFVPSAELNGRIHLEPTGMTFEGRVADKVDIPVSMAFFSGETHAVVDIEAAYSSRMESALRGAFERAETEVESAVKQLEEAIENLEFEVSLRGLRSALPGIADQVIRTLNSVPDGVYSAVNSRARTEIEKYNRCALGACLIPGSVRNSVAAKAASTARDKARDEVAPYIRIMNELKRRALEDDDEALRSALEDALRTAYRYRVFDRTFSYTVGVKGIFTRTFSYRVNRTVLSASQAQQILFAADNMHRIPAASDLVIRGREIVDNLPARDTLEQVRKDVEGGVRQVPGVSEVGYSVISGVYTGYVRTDDGQVYSVEFNVMDPTAALPGIADLLLSLALDR